MRGGRGAGQVITAPICSTLNGYTCLPDRLYIPLPSLVEEGLTWLADNSGAKMLLISGSPAMGKSMLANHLARASMPGSNPTSSREGLVQVLISCQPSTCKWCCLCMIASRIGVRTSFIAMPAGEWIAHGEGGRSQNQESKFVQ